MEIVKKKIDDIIPASYNPRKALMVADKEYHDIKNSIEMFGLVVPFVVNKRTGNLVNGHQRLTVLKDLGYTEVHVSLVDMDEKKEKALNLALSRIDGDFDNKALVNVMAEIRAFGIDPIGLGFTKSEIDKMFPTDMEVESLFGNDSDNKYSDYEGDPEETEVVAMVGKYRFTMEKSEMEQVMADIRYRNGFVKEKVENEIKNRFLYGKDWSKHLGNAANGVQDNED